MEKSKGEKGGRRKGCLNELALRGNKENSSQLDGQTHRPGKRVASNRGIWRIQIELILGTPIKWEKYTMSLCLTGSSISQVWDIRLKTEKKKRRIGDPGH